MTRYAVLLRAVNVAGHNKIAMAALRELLGELGFAEVATYIQSGNIVCSSDQNPATTAATIRRGILERFGHDIVVMVRTATEFSDIVRGFPYPKADPKSSGVVFLDAEFDGDLDASAFAPDECTVAGSEVYVNCPTRFADTKLTAAWIEKHTATNGTRRNWATVLKLHDMLAS